MRPTILFTFILSIALLGTACKKDEPEPPAAPYVAPDPVPLHHAEVRITCPGGYWYSMWAAIPNGHATQDTTFTTDVPSGYQFFTVCQWDGAAGTQRLYVDGTLRSTGASGQGVSIITYTIP